MSGDGERRPPFLFCGGGGEERGLRAADELRRGGERARDEEDEEEKGEGEREEEEEKESGDGERPAAARFAIAGVVSVSPLSLSCLCS